MRSTITDNALSSGARHLFHVLKDFARGKNWPECWPFLWRIVDESGKCRRMVLYYLNELEKVGAVERLRTPGKGNRYRILLSVNDKIGDWCTITPVQPIAPVPVQPIAPVPVQPIAPVVETHIIEEADTKQAAQGTEVPAAAAEEISLEKEMQSRTQSVFDKLVKLGMPASDQALRIVTADPDLARDALRHCEKRFRQGGKPVDNHGGYITSLLRDPSKFGFVQRDGRWHDPAAPSGPSPEEFAKMVEARTAKNLKERAERQARAENAYAEMRDTWTSLPEVAKQEIHDFVMKDSPLLHASGTNTVEFELACMNEATSMGRTNWLRRQRGLPPLQKLMCKQRG